MATLAIRDHATRGKEVIEILEMLGGKQTSDIIVEENSFYTIEDGIIKTGVCGLGDEYYTMYTLKEFLEKFPYKVGDKVIYKSEILPIIGMKWRDSNNTVIYTMKSNCGTIDCYDSTWMKPYKEQEPMSIPETMKQITNIAENLIKIDIPNGYEFAGVDNQQVVFEKVNPQYPKTYEECCDILELSYISYCVGYKEDLLDDFQKLLICRDAYWKIYGFNPKTKSEVYYMNSLPSYLRDLFPMPTEEMRYIFYKNFKNKLENCKNLFSYGDY